MKVLVLVVSLLLTGCAVKKPARVEMVLAVTPDCVDKMVLLEPCPLIPGEKPHCKTDITYHCVTPIPRPKK